MVLAVCSWKRSKNRHAIQAAVRVEEVLKTTGTWLENKSDHVVWDNIIHNISILCLLWLFWCYPSCWLNTIESHILVVNSDIILVESLICLWQQTNAPQHVPNMLAFERVLVHLLQCLLHLAQNEGLNAVLQEASTKIKLLGPGEWVTIVAVELGYGNPKNNRKRKSHWNRSRRYVLSIWGECYFIFPS